MGERKAYQGEGFTVHFETSRCIHSSECVRRLPGVFNPQARPWIAPTNATVDAVAAAITRCPTGALTMTRDDGAACETVASETTVRVTRDGPLVLRGQLLLCDAAGEPLDAAPECRMALCRCGASRNKPFCDGSHTALGFTEAGQIAAAPGKPTPAEGGTALRIIPINDGPLHLTGGLTLIDAAQRRGQPMEEAWLCRCGASAKKPFCDGSHKRIGFRSDGPTPDSEPPTNSGT